jgi:mannose-6-phosphate isomerase
LNKISILKNPVQEYAWGSKTALQGLIGKDVPTDKPAAELWMGAHPKAPSKAFVDGEWKTLDKAIEDNPELILGTNVAERFSNKLPFLFKVIAADRPLSVQVHPNLDQARAGFARENSLRIPLNASNRNYKDENHKPEILCALTSFQALKGFRKIEEILGLMDKALPSSLSHELGQLRKHPDTEGLKHFFNVIFKMDRSQQSLVVKESVSLVEGCTNEHQAFHLMAKLNREYPGDIGVLSPLFLNLVQLEPGEAIYLPAGELHTYLHGVGVELMANSDNVLRSGLTSKHIDASELLEIVDFKIDPLQIVKPVGRGTCETMYPTPANEFLLSEISVDEGHPFTSPRDRSVEILICVKGKAHIRDMAGGKVLALKKGQSIIVPASVSLYRIEGNAKLFKASVSL